MKNKVTQMQAAKLSVMIDDSRKITIDLPIWFPVGEAEIIVLTESASVIQATNSKKNADNFPDISP